MRVLRTIAEVRTAVAGLRAQRRTIGLVPTMGALHDGHLSLVRAARSRCDEVIATIFVNPLQFGPNEDFSKYPRTFDNDCRLFEAEGVDLLFAPETAEMVPPGATTIVEVQQLQDRLDGASRPGHFRGVTTIVAKLFHIVGPDQAFFGQKDAAQVAILRRMVRDLNFPLELVVCPIVRELDGLAMSSRNRYLSPEDRERALVLFCALLKVQERVAAGISDSAALLDAGLTFFAEEPSVRLDYFRIVDPDTLEDLPDVRRGALIAVAAWVGPARLIDNLLVQPSQLVQPGLAAP